MLTCYIKKTTGYECPGCGFQRSFLKLINGDFYESLTLYPSLIPFISLCLFTLIHLKFMFKNGAKIILALFICTTLFTVVNFISKII
ncbi:MAG: DUF2752 domain-containing protein [Flavobacteriales bacterium]|nr:DUF2752 domain-containing protein [Flavobacteriales bacterium]